MPTALRRQLPLGCARRPSCFLPTSPVCSTATARSSRRSTPTMRARFCRRTSSAAACARSSRPHCRRWRPESAPFASVKEERHLLLHDESPAAVEAREKNFILGTYARTPFHPRSGKGARLVDADGHIYWDLLGGIAVNVLGHQHPRLVRTLRDESRSLLHVSNLFY